MSRSVGNSEYAADDSAPQLVSSAASFQRQHICRQRSSPFLLQAAKFERNSLKNCTNQIIATMLGCKSHEGAWRAATSGAAFSHQKRKKEKVMGARRCRHGD
jgi:hypothetical protein